MAVTEQVPAPGGTSETMTDDTQHPPTENEFRSPAASIATRRIAKRSKASSRGAIVARFPGSDTDQIVQFESTLEERVLYLLLARPDIVHIWEQPPAIRYTDPKGHNRPHTFDFLVRSGDGQRTAIMVKPHQVAIGSAFRKEVHAIRAVLRKDFADRMALITDAHFTWEEAANAQRLHVFRRVIRPSDDARLNEVLCTDCLMFPTTMKKIVEALGIGGAGFQVTFAALYDGRLLADLTCAVTPDTVVKRGVQS